MHRINEEPFTEPVKTGSQIPPLLSEDLPLCVKPLAQPHFDPQGKYTK